MQNKLYRGMIETELNNAYNNTAIVKDFDGLLKKLQARSRALYKSITGSVIGLMAVSPGNATTSCHLV